MLCRVTCSYMNSGGISVNNNSEWILEGINALYVKVLPEILPTLPLHIFVRPFAYIFNELE